MLCSFWAMDPLDTDNPMLHRSQERLERHVRNLEELAEIGMTLARAVNREVLLQDMAQNGTAPTQPAGISLSDLGLIFARVSRAVRQTMAMESEVDADRRSLEAFVKSDPLKQTALARRHGGQTADRATSGLPRMSREDLLSDLDENLSDPNYLANLSDAAIESALTRLQRDMGLDPAADSAADEREDELWDDEAEVPPDTACWQKPIGETGEREQTGISRPNSGPSGGTGPPE